MSCLKFPIPLYSAWNNLLGMNTLHIIPCWPDPFSAVTRFFQSLQVIYNDAFFKITGTKVESYVPISRPFILIPNYCDWLLLIKCTIVCNCCIRKAFSIFLQNVNYFLFGWEIISLARFSFSSGTVNSIVKFSIICFGVKKFILYSKGLSLTSFGCSSFCKEISCRKNLFKSFFGDCSSTCLNQSCQSQDHDALCIFSAGYQLDH